MIDKQPIIVITGANGFLGSKLVEHYLGKGWGVRALVHKPGAISSHKNLEIFKYDLSKKISNSSEIFKGADYLIHTAYVKATKSNRDAYEVNVGGANEIMRASNKYRLKRSIFISSMSAHEGAISVYGKQKLAIEAVFNDDKSVVLRCGLIIGNGGIVGTMGGLIKKFHIIPMVGNGRQPLQIVAVYDLIKVIDVVIDKDIGGQFTIANPTVYSYKDFYKLLMNQLHTYALLIPVPFFVLNLALFFVERFNLPLGIDRDNALGLRKLISVDNKADLKRLGVTLDDLPKALVRSNTT